MSNETRSVRKLQNSFVKKDVLQNTEDIKDLVQEVLVLVKEMTANSSQNSEYQSPHSEILRNNSYLIDQVNDLRSYLLDRGVSWADRISYQLQRIQSSLQEIGKIYMDVPPATKENISSEHRETLEYLAVPLSDKSEV